MKKLVFGLMIALTVFAACSKDDDNKEVTVEDGSYVGTVTVVEPPFSASDIKVSVTPIEGTTTLDIKMFEVRFSERMPKTIDFTIPKASYTIDGDTINIFGENIIPTMGAGYEKPEYIVTGLKGTIKDGNIEFSLNFGSFPTKYSGTLAKK
ncbi:MAG: hypothetical protein II637_03565 [Bacteroidales bacterium]|nr:hypothetical protein [Bacteroidales bacterium]